MLCDIDWLTYAWINMHANARAGINFDNVVFAVSANVSADRWKVVLVFVIMSVCGAFISMIGDLAASAIKRNRGIKDYGKIIPGHGGVMDRFDSFIFVAPLVYILCLFIV